MLHVQTDSWSQSPAQVTHRFCADENFGDFVPERLRSKFNLQIWTESSLCASTQKLSAGSTLSSRTSSTLTNTFLNVRHSCRDSLLMSLINQSTNQPVWSFQRLRCVSSYLCRWVSGVLGEVLRCSSAQLCSVNAAWALTPHRFYSRARSCWRCP